MMPTTQSYKIILPPFLTGVEISNASIPPFLDGATARGVLWQAAPQRFLLDLPEVARYLVEDGRRIAVEASPGADRTEVARFMKMTPLAALLFQRGTMVFHAAVVADDKGAVLIAGDSGSGKSTLAAEMMRRGWTLLADDLAHVDLDDDGKPTAFPVSPEIVLWPDAMEKMEALSAIGYDVLGSDGRRHIISFPDRFSSCARPVRAVYWLSVCNEDKIDIKEIAGAERFGSWGLLSYNSHIADTLLDRNIFFRKASILSASVRLTRLKRPRGKWCVEGLADILSKGAP